MGDRLFAALLWPLPQHALSRVVHGFTRLQAGAFSHWLIRRFVAAFGVNMAEAAEPNPAAYPSFNAFFTRALRDAARPLANTTPALLAPADAVISQIGPIDGETLLQAKGRHYTLTELLGGDAELVDHYRDGHFATFYLSPRDYHRVHMPLAGTLRRMVYVPGRLFSVNARTTRAVPKLFARNERVICHFDTEHGPMALILVGAIFVGSIETVWAGEITPPHRRNIESIDYPNNGTNIRLEQGAEMGRFNMGSTVIMLTHSHWHWQAEHQPDRPVQFRQPLAEPT